MPVRVEQNAQYRAVMGNFPTGVVVVTGMSDGVPVGLTVQSFMSLSLDPPMVLLSVDRKSTTWPLIAAGARFAVNVMASDQQAVALAFAKSGTDKFAGMRWDLAPVTGAPLLSGCQAWVEAQVVDTFDGGDHVIVTADVLSMRPGDDGSEPLVFFRSNFRRLE
ncbi:flavin reductase family protein [Mycolicibacterium vaccae]|uniref:flavin reductase family protein n=1 Tax=Mycolicibacterium vaccae TaxID=1810 RepID=UPI003CF90D76